jgi:hypothetical protein
MSKLQGDGVERVAGGFATNHDLGLPVPEVKRELDLQRQSGDRLRPHRSGGRRPPPRESITFPGSKFAHPFDRRAGLRSKAAREAKHGDGAERCGQPPAPTGLLSIHALPTVNMLKFCFHRIHRIHRSITLFLPFMLFLPDAATFSQLRRRRKPGAFPPARPRAPLGGRHLALPPPSPPASSPASPIGPVQGHSGLFKPIQAKYFFRAGSKTSAGPVAPRFSFARSASP